MRTYWAERVVIVFGILFLFASFELLIVDPLKRWMLLMVITYVVGFTHYFVGGFYQARFLGKAEGRRAWLWIGLFSIVSLFIPLVFYAFGQIGLFAFVTIGYFMLHGYFNELTLFERTADRPADRGLVGSSMLIILGVLFLSTNHPSRLFDPYLTFFAEKDVARSLIEVIRAVGEVGWYIGLGCFVLAGAVFVANQWRKRSVRQVLLRTSILLGSMGALAALAPFSYVHLLSTVLLYHFLIWFWFYAKRFGQRADGSLWFYLFLHVGALAPIIILITVSGLDLARLFIINSYVFLALTTVHITTSFLSERWLQRWVFPARE